MRMTLASIVLTTLVACGGSEPAPKPKQAEKPVAEKPKPAPTPEEKAEPAPDLTAMGEEEQLAYLMELGKKVYETGGTGGIPCSTCHQLDGNGTPGAFPPLVGQKELMGDCGQHATYVVKGLTGKITVNGVEYNGAMPAQANLSDLEIAAVITYERNSWGNDFGLCLPETVAAIR